MAEKLATKQRALMTLPNALLKPAPTQAELALDEATKVVEE